MPKFTHSLEDFSMVTRNRTDDVHVRFEDGQFVPAVCVKVRGRLLDRVPKDVRDAPEAIRSAAYAYVEGDWWQGTPQELANEYLAPAFRGCKVEARGVGRSSGWVAVFGIGGPADWTRKQLDAWRAFEAQIASTIDDAEDLFVAEVRERVQQ